MKIGILFGTKPMNRCRLTSIIQTTDGGYLIGSSDSDIHEKTDNSRGNIDIWIIKIDQSGNIMWKKTFEAAI
jgi:hypothetical protein